VAATILEIDGVDVSGEETPESPQELARIMKEVHDAGKPMAAVGSGTKLHLGNPLRAACVAMRTRRLSGIVEYEPDNLTVSVLAGTPLRELQETLRAHNQFLPLDPPLAERATLGGIVACNSSGPLRFRYGTVRDMLIGIGIVHADGTATKAGGKLVKNVSGYDMCKLYAGSLGTLGIFSDLTFKVQPRSDAVATVMLGYASLRQAFEATQALLRADLAPDTLEALSGAAFAQLTGDAPVAPWILLVRFGESDCAVRWQVDSLRGIASASGGTIANALGTKESEEFWQRAASARESCDSDEPLLVKCSVMYKSAPDTGQFMADLGDRLQARTLLYCHCGSYILYGRYEWPQGACSAEALLREIAALRRYCAAAGGHAVVEKIRSDVKRSLDVWGYEGQAIDLMRRIKNEFDPNGLLNPGRFVGGI